MEGGKWMPGVKISEDDFLSELRKRQFYEKPSVKRKKKSLAARKRASKNYRRYSNR